MNLRKFDARLRALAPSDSRPFLCEGSPLECDVFLVGLNPRTRTPFWEFWDPAYGCRKKEWLESYRQREGKLGCTRTYIEILFEALAPCRCLETNLYAAWSDRLADLPAEQRTTEIFDFLLHTIRPQLLFVHGRKAIQHVERLADCSLPRDELHRVRLAGCDTEVYARHHLSFQFSKRDCQQLAARLRDHVLDRSTNER